MTALSAVGERVPTLNAVGLYAQQHLAEFAFPTVYARSDAPNLSLDHAGILKALRSSQSRLVRRLFHAPDHAAFVREVSDIARPYGELSAAIGHTIAACADRRQIRELADESLRRLRKDFTGTIPRIGADAAAEVEFTLATLRSALRLLSSVVGTPAPQSLLQRDAELARTFERESRILEMSMHMLVLVIREPELPLRPFVLEAILGGLRSTVRMYGAIGAAARLRRSQDLELQFGEDDCLDEEERQLLEWSADDGGNTLRVEGA